ncbi:hypothetical protein MP228_006270 [Amoeboaphelidium protococcarum]|nr:hypothetical protein MP228_006270 [Amoeboaphelidium protococcarum]
MASLARQNWAQQTEDGVNSQINFELKASHAYLSMASYFGRDNVALPGFQKFFYEQSKEEREHAEKLIKYQNMRGGVVKLKTIDEPTTEWKSARYAMEMALQMEREVNANLLKLHGIAAEQQDPQLCDYLEGEFLKEQVESIKQISDMLTQLERVGNDGLGLYLFDKELHASLH